jgi:hypothetical protein
MIIRYREIGGQVVKDIVHRPQMRGETPPDRHFTDTLLKAHYALECEQGSRYRSGYTKAQTKRVLEGARARDGAS